MKLIETLVIRLVIALVLVAVIFGPLFVLIGPPEILRPYLPLWLNF